MEAVFWKLRTGVPWRNLPTEFGSHANVFNKFNRWSKQGSWQNLLIKISRLVENLSARLKQFRSIATRYDKSKNNFASIIYMGVFHYLT